MTIDFKESDLRDYLALNIAALEDGMVLLGKEKYLPASLCTRSFIDLIARDSNGKLVLIEVKKTAPASREAIHEVLKYVEAAKDHFGMRENEMRVIVASAKWEELLIPFSSFVQRVEFQVKGVLLEINSAGEVLSAKDVEPLSIRSDRVFSPYYEFQFYECWRKVDYGIEVFETMCKSKGINSFVLVILRRPHDRPDGIPSQRQITMRATLTEMASLIGSEVKDLANPTYEAVICFAMQQLSEEEYLQCFPNSEAQSDATEMLGECEEEEALWMLHDALMATEPCSEGDFKDIGTPAKLRSQLIEEDGWIVDRITRYGSFKRNAVLSDHEIISELCGSTGANRQTLSMDFTPSIRSEVAELRKRVDACLCDNPSWRAQIHAIIDILVKDKEKRKCFIHVYNPSSALTTIYLVASQEDGVLSIPTYHIDVPKIGIEKMYCGLLKKGEETQMRLSQILKEFYDCSLEMLLFTLNWGGYEIRDTEIMRRLDMKYKTICVTVDGSERSFAELDESVWISCAAVNWIEEYHSFLDSNELFVQEICQAYSSHWDGRIVRFDN